MKSFRLISAFAAASMVILPLSLISSLARAGAEGAAATNTAGAASSAAATDSTTAPGELLYNAKIYQMGTKTQLFSYQGRLDQSGATRIQTNTYKDSEGKVVAVETITTAKPDGAKLLAYSMDQRQLEAHGTIQVKEGRAYFTYERNGKTKKDDEKAGDDFIVGPTLTEFLGHHWSEIEAGKRVEAKFAVVDRQEGVHFEYFRDHEDTVDGQKRFAIKMKPSSMIIAALVDPLFFVYSADGKKLFEVHGRTQLSTKVDGKWKPLDADTIFDYTGVPPKP